MNAVVTIRLTPTEFDLLRKAIDALIAEDYEITKNHDLDASIRAAARAQHVQISDLKAKLV